MKPGVRVAVLGVRDAEFERQLRERGVDGDHSGAASGLDLIFFGAETPDDLALLAKLPGRIKRGGAIWVITPRGDPSVGEGVVMAAGKAAGLVDVKVARFSATHTALKFVIPRAQR